MPKVSLNYEFDPVADQEELQVQLNAHKLYSAATDFAQWLRTQKKYGDKPMLHVDDVYVEFHNLFEGLLS